MSRDGAFFSWIETAGQVVVYGPGGVVQAETWSHDIADAVVEYLKAHPEKRYTATERHADIDRASPMGLCGMKCQEEQEKARLLDEDSARIFA